MLGQSGGEGGVIFILISSHKDFSYHKELV